ncbi:pentapeptide repeat-containing protein [Mycobacterium sp. RTGN5]|uniref:pentapeptide repeat-containing protein n=1 Tax=Mycobacterium sp. RTGN5 TaxID=3016522 RepID=UPI0029C864D5|nr:pentapeptide repeat-containing protein [Mycobacterium sp. RTGN5]
MNLGVLLVVLVVAVCVIAVTGVVYLAIPPVRRFIRKDPPVWWVRDVFIAVVVALLVLVGASYLTKVNSGGQASPQDQQSSASQDQNSPAGRLNSLQFVQGRSSVAYEPRPFRQFDLKGMNLAGLQLKGANLVQADLTGANLAGTDLSADPAIPAAPDAPAVAGHPAFLQGVNLCHAVLTGANFTTAYLVNANLTGVDLTTTRLNGAVLNGADLSQAVLPSDAGGKDRFLKGVHYDQNTVWPKDFQPPPAGTDDRFKFLSDPVNQALYGNVPRPACHS